MSSSMKRARRLGGSSLAIAAALGSSVYAQVPETRAAEAPEARIDEIIVTAQRKAESLQETPIAISAVSFEQIQARGIDTVTEFATSVPAVSIKSDFGTVNPNIYIRGVGSTDFNANVTGAVGVYVDDVIKASPAGQLLQYYDIDRIEVLRGPQGTLYGRNTTAGAIRVITAKPTDETTGNLFASYGRFNEIKLEGGVGGPIVDGVLSGRISGILNTRDGTIDNRNPRNNLDAANSNPVGDAPDKLNDIDTRALRGQLRFTPSSSADILLSAHFGRSDTSSYVFQHRGLLDPDNPVNADGSGNFCDDSRLDQGICIDYAGYADTDGDPFAGSYNGPSFEGVKNYGASLNAEFALGDLTLTSITAYEDTLRATILEVDESPNSLAIPYHNADYGQFTQEFQLASSPTARLGWQVGAYYFQEDLTFNGEFEFNAPLLGGAGLAIAPRYGYEQDVESWALFGQAYYDLSDRLSATIGLRYNEEDREIDYRSGLSFVESRVPGYVSDPGYTLGNPYDYTLRGTYGNDILPLISLNDQTNDPLRTNSLSNNDLSWRAALDFQASDDVFLFGSVSRGTKAGGFNGSFQTDVSQNVPLADEQLTSYEAGIKSTLFDGLLRANLTAFYYDYEDLQTYILGSVPGQTTPAQSPVNVNAENYGGELELLARPTENLTLSVDFSYLKNEVTSLGSGGVNPVVDVVGNPLPIAPEFSITGYASYDIPTSDSGTFTIGTDFYYQDASTSDITNTPRLATDSYFLLGLRGAWKPTNENWEFAVYGRNILGDEYRTFVANIDFLGYDRVRFGEQSTYGASVSYRF